MVLLGEETEVYSYLIPLIKLLVSAVIIDKFVLCSNSDFGESVGLTPTPLLHLGKGLFLRGCIMRRRLKTQGLRFFCGEANQADDLPNLLFGQRDPSSHVLIFSVLLGLTERFFLFLLYGQLCFFTFLCFFFTQKIKHSQPPPERV
jgi:hypothetical protein